jgi:hypothetical protein
MTTARETEVTSQCRAYLVDSKPVASVPIKSPTRIAWGDRYGKRVRGYLVNVDALTLEELEAIHLDCKERIPGTPSFTEWLRIVRREGMPIREERVSSISIPLRLVI